jgi:predicted chitinase
MLTVDSLRAIMPRLSPVQAEGYLSPLVEACEQGAVNTPLRLSAFLAQLAHESGELRYFEELATGQAYEGRADLGNVKPGDGRRFKGRGPIQLTGRLNYRAAGRSLGLDLEEHPEQAALPAVGFRVAVWYWTTRHLNDLADKGTDVAFGAITKRINGGTNGLAQREVYYLAARQALGLPPL